MRLQLAGTNIDASKARSNTHKHARVLAYTPPWLLAPFFALTHSAVESAVMHPHISIRHYALVVLPAQPPIWAAVQVRRIHRRHDRGVSRQVERGGGLGWGEDGGVAAGRGVVGWVVGWADLPTLGSREARTTMWPCQQGVGRERGNGRAEGWDRQRGNVKRPRFSRCKHNGRGGLVGRLPCVSNVQSKGCHWILPVWPWQEGGGGGSRMLPLSYTIVPDTVVPPACYVL